MLRNKRTLAILTVLVLAVFALAGCGTKATGGGWIQSASCVKGEKATFGFNAQLLPEDKWTNQVNAKGQFQFVDHGMNFKFHGEVLHVVVYEGPFDNDEIAIFSGITKDGDIFEVTVYDSNHDGGPSDGDTIQVAVDGYFNAGTLHGGNISVR